jgi:hypothetical protein
MADSGGGADHPCEGQASTALLGEHSGCFQVRLARSSGTTIFREPMLNSRSIPCSACLRAVGAGSYRPAPKSSASAIGADGSDLSSS